MSKEKRYYWLKLKTDFFNLAEIEFLLSQSDGCKYVVLYQMLCLQTANNNGELSSKVGEMIIPYDPDKIVRDTKFFSKDTVIVALELFKKLNLIYTDDGTCLRISNFETMVGKDTNWAEQKRRQRERQKLLGGLCPPDVFQGNGQIFSGGQCLPMSMDKGGQCPLDTNTGGQCLPDVSQNVHIEIEKEDRIRLDNINLYLNNITLVQNETDKYNTTLKLKKVYLESTTYMPQDLINKYKLYQFAIKRFVDNKQTALLDKINLPLLEKVFVQVSKTKNIDNIVEYYISSVINELTRR